MNILYQGARCFIFPSLYEGFGLPPLEAMNVGCPVITSQAASLPEVCGNAAMYVNPYDVDDIAQKLDRLLNDSALREELSKQGKERAQLFRMENYLERLFDAYKLLMK